MQDFASPKHARSAAKGRSAIAEARDAIVRFVYGREWVLRSPGHITTDSRQRLIISDPAVPAVHVLNPKNHESFRIVGGPGRRMHAPRGVAVDALDNIYVAEAERGVVLVYRSNGDFLRTIGDLGGGEGLFHDPGSIAVSGKAGRLYVIDGPRLFVLDLAGNVLQRIGTSRGNNGDVLDARDLVVIKDELLVLDSEGRRVQVFDPEIRLLRSIALVNAPAANDAGLAVSSNGDMYVNSPTASLVRGYDRRGAALGSFGGWGMKLGEMNSPSGIWIGSDRVYVSESANVRVQVFQISH